MWSNRQKGKSKYISGGEQFYAEKLNNVNGIVNLKDRGGVKASPIRTSESLKGGVGEQAMRIWGQVTPRQRRVQCKGSKVKFAWCVCGTMRMPEYIEQVRGGVFGDEEGELMAVGEQLHTELCDQS